MPAMEGDQLGRRWKHPETYRAVRQHLGNKRCQGRRSNMKRHSVHPNTLSLQSSSLGRNAHEGCESCVVSCCHYRVHYVVWGSLLLVQRRLRGSHDRNQGPDSDPEESASRWHAKAPRLHARHLVSKRPHKVAAYTMQQGDTATCSIGLGMLPEEGISKQVRLCRGTSEKYEVHCTVGE